MVADHVQVNRQNGGIYKEMHVCCTEAIQEGWQHSWQHFTNGK